jgi:biopolymer transport protein ExbD
MAPRVSDPINALQFVRASGPITYGVVVEALDAARAAGGTRIGMLGSERRERRGD